MYEQGEGEFNGWHNRETWAFVMITNQDPNRQHWVQWRAAQLLDDMPKASPAFIGEQLVYETKRWARQYYKRNETATFLVDEVGSFWRVDYDEIGQDLVDWSAIGQAGGES